MKVIVGLGNPGREYGGTRHNAGFIVVDELAQRHHLTDTRSQFHGLTCHGQVAGERCVLLKPTTFMNRSGRAVRAIVDFYKLDIDDLLVVVDDTALPCGKLRVRPTGSAGGHNGLKDIERVLGTRDYARLRVGIGQPGVMTQHDYVLGTFTFEEREILGIVRSKACNAIETWLDAGVTAAMNAVNAWSAVPENSD